MSQLLSNVIWVSMQDLPPALYRLPSAVCRLPSAVCRLPFAVCRLQPASPQKPHLAAGRKKGKPAGLHWWFCLHHTAVLIKLSGGALTIVSAPGVDAAPGHLKILTPRGAHAVSPTAHSTSYQTANSTDSGLPAPQVNLCPPATHLPSVTGAAPLHLGMQAPASFLRPGHGTYPTQNSSK
ncbi:hypothetical protein DHEL01_v210106 [Diaporthe helianthi]|uniref:Uncharacterized protein n=1 Tax=Diaporthe helianthi TaxID=158607 RepID=A0A2P5HML3_DIAHE|nr:hypothetical protein DHEL01_v210106 [Diaporthe helianthi]